MAFATKVSGREFDELIRPKLKIFLSVDVVGSTALKQSGRNFDYPPTLREGPEFVNGDWFRFITSFYREFPSTLVNAFSETRERRQKELGDRPPNPPMMWKALGDELIFSAELRGERDASIHLESLARAINESVKTWAEGKCPLPVSFKGTAWLAGFPVGNSEMPMWAVDAVPGVPECSIGDDLYDYSGPAMDIGFRLARFATPRRLILSAELADFVLGDHDPCLKDHIWAEEPVELKGVLRGRPYPLFWYDCYSVAVELREADLARMEDGMLERKKMHASSAKTYLEEWFKATGACFKRPFIYDLPEHGSRILPKFEKELEAVVAQLRHIYQPASTEDEGNGSPEGDAKLDQLPDRPPNCT